MSPAFRNILIFLVVLLMGAAGYFAGSYRADKVGYDRGFAEAQVQEAKRQALIEERAQEQMKLSEDATASTSANPADDVQSDPLKETKKTLNPF